MRRVPTRYPFATFDYATLCREPLTRTDAYFVQASVRGCVPAECPQREPAEGVRTRTNRPCARGGRSLH